MSKKRKMPKRPAPMTPLDCDVSGIPFPDSLIDAFAEQFGRSREEVIAAMPTQVRSH